ncbi:hypothetical protein EJ903_05745 [Azospirillum griseum]|uniref:Uncharacterized protein n=1 Tax=Azospirillum griseum TaxID=2496639 RepID=A0A3S0IHH3_9PROT|nr:hypothetical protein EJ903_05745 [Azospirillum griseum]
MVKKVALFCIAAALGALSATAQAAETYKFNLHNKSTDSVINGFRTYENGAWSKNWINFTLKPGEAAEMDWGSNDGNCVVPFKVSWIGYDAEQFKVDWCKVKNIYMLDKGFSFD